MRRLREIAREQRGIALIIVLMITMILTVLILDLHQSVRIHFYIATNLSDGVKASYLVRSGVQTAAGALLKDLQHNAVDHWNEDWYDFLGKLGMPGIPVSDGETLLMDINDESGRFNLNLLVDKRGAINKTNYEVFKNLLTVLDLDVKLADAIVDYIDADAETADGAGMEDQVYAYTAQSTTAKNGRFESLQEVRLVTGVTDDVWNKLEPVVTIYGDPKMNLNTVDPRIIKAVIKTIDEQADTSIADKIDQWRRQGAAGDVSSALSGGEGNYFTAKNMGPKLGEIGMDAKLTGRFVKNFFVASHFFRVNCTALVRGVQKNALAIVFRYKKKASIIYYRVAPGVSSANFDKSGQSGADATPGTGLTAPNSTGSATSTL